MLEVLAQAVGEVVRRFDDRRRAFDGDRCGGNLEAQQLAGDCAVVQRRDLLGAQAKARRQVRSEEHTSELTVTNAHLVCRLLLEKKKQQQSTLKTLRVKLRI